MKVRYLVISLLLISGSFFGCKSLFTNPVDTKTPVAKILVTSNTLNAGSYCILDGSQSQKGEGDTLIYNWEADQANPDQINVFNDPVEKITFVKEGLYKFRLSINNGKATSNTAQVEIKVNPRSSSVFEDPSLEAQVRYALKIPVGNLTAQDLLSLDSLASYSIFTKPVYSLKGLENCTNLKFLHQNLQKISEISSLTNLVKLEELTLSQNRVIKDITPLRNLTHLRKLDLQSNKVEDISALENLTSLTYLNLIDNSIKSLAPIGKLTNLNELWLCYTQDNNISFIKNLNNLSLLWMPSCNINDVSPLKNMTNLRRINFDGNKISDITPIISIKLLEWLYLSDNQITDITPLEYLENLVRLRLWNNKITDILPLIKNKGIGYGDSVGLFGNPLNDTSINVYISELRERGVLVEW
ncbi:MAG: leucine-rich repeat domain-containing protein [Bacteroidota bacterium]|nr:leucine-rich repeat domain-containing protein [Bacteroidota bacterium]